MRIKVFTKRMEVRGGGETIGFPDSLQN